MGIPPAPRGVPKIEVTFDIDANGIVNVSARDNGTNKEQQIVIQSSGGLNKEQMERMVREAEEHASDDHARRELAEAANQADGIITDTEHKITEYKEQLDADKIAELEEMIVKLREMLGNKDAQSAEELRTAVTDLQQRTLDAFKGVYDKV